MGGSSTYKNLPGQVSKVTLWMAYAEQEMMDETFSTLSNIHRRRVLFALLERNPRTAAEVSVPEDTYTGEEDLETLKVQMHHCHLPKLEAAGFISWNKETDQVTKGPRFDKIEPLLELLIQHSNGSACNS